MSVLVRNDDFELLQGEIDRYERKADSGNIINMNFCSHCHGWLWNAPPGPGAGEFPQGRRWPHPAFRCLD